MWSSKSEPSTSMDATAGLTRWSTVRVTVRSLSNGGVTGGVTTTGGRDRPPVTAPTGTTRTAISFLSSRCSRLGRNFLVGCLLMAGLLAAFAAVELALDHG